MTDMAASQEPPATVSKAATTPPYVAWATLQSTIERMESEGEAPSRLDRSYLKNMPGGTQSRFRQACKWLGLVDEEDEPTDTLRELVNSPERRKELVASLLREHYSGPLALPTNATPQMLEETFREMGASGSDTLRKSVAFFLHACKYADIELSKQFVQPRTRRPSGAAPRRAKRRNGAATPDQSQQEVEKPKDEAPNIIRDLLTKLPPEGSKWRREKVEQWLGIAKLTFEMVYELEGEYTDSGAPGAGSPGGGLS